MPAAQQFQSGQQVKFSPTLEKMANSKSHYSEHQHSQYSQSQFSNRMESSQHQPIYLNQTNNYNIMYKKEDQNLSRNNSQSFSIQEVENNRKKPVNRFENNFNFNRQDDREERDVNARYSEYIRMDQVREDQKSLSKNHSLSPMRVGSQA